MLCSIDQIVESIVKIYLRFIKVQIEILAIIRSLVIPNIISIIMT